MPLTEKHWQNKIGNMFFLGKFWGGGRGGTYGYAADDKFRLEVDPSKARELSRAIVSDAGELLTARETVINVGGQELRSISRVSSPSLRPKLRTECACASAGAL